MIIILYILYAANTDIKILDHRDFWTIKMFKTIEWRICHRCAGQLVCRDSGL